MESNFSLFCWCVISVGCIFASIVYLLLFRSGKVVKPWEQKAITFTTLFVILVCILLYKTLLQVKAVNIAALCILIVGNYLIYKKTPAQLNKQARKYNGKMQKALSV